MLSDEVVFIDHNSKTGKISRDSARKVWTHVSRRSRQKRPGKVVIKQWTPRGCHDQIRKQQPYRAGSGPGPSPYTLRNGLHYAYISKVGLKRIDPPTELRAVEVLLAVQYQHFQRCVPIDDAIRSRRDSEYFYTYQDQTTRMVVADRSIHTGITMFEAGNILKAFASFEMAFGYLKSAIYDFNVYLPCKILSCVFRAYLAGMFDFVRVLITYLDKAITIKLGSHHCLALWVQNLRSIPTTIDAFEILCHTMWTQFSESHGTITCGLNFDDSWGVFEITLMTLGTKCAVSKAESMYQELIERGPVESDRWRYVKQDLSMEMARFYLARRCYDKAESAVSDAYDNLREYASEGWLPSIIHPPPLAMTMIIARLHLLGQALAGQDKNEKADKAFRAAILTSYHFHFEEDPVCIEALETYLRFLRTQKRTADAEAVQSQLDHLTEPFDSAARQGMQESEPYEVSQTPGLGESVPLPVKVVDSLMW